MSNISCIALVGNAPAEKREMLNSFLDEEGLTEMYDIALYGADGQPEISALRDAIKDYEEGSVDAIVCLPMAQPLRENLKELNGNEATPVYVSTMGRLSPVRHDTSAGEVGKNLTQEEITKAAKELWRTLKRDLGVQNPRIAITSLNNEIKAEESSAEIAVIAPAVSELVKEGIQVFGPTTPEKLFGKDDFMAFDAVIEIYEGQCMEAFTKATNEPITTLMSGIEIPVTQTEPEGLFKAIDLAMDVERNRSNYDKITANPLPKLYHEKKEDGDKARFAIKKKGFNPAEHRRENVTYIKASDHSTPPTEEKTAKE